MNHLTLRTLAAAALMAISGAALADSATSTNLDPGTATTTTSNGSTVTGAAANGTFTVNQYNGSDILTGMTFSAGATQTLGFSKTNNSSAGTGALNLSVTLGGTTAGATATSPTVNLSNGSPTASQNVTTTIGSSSVANLGSFYGNSTVGGTVSQSITASKSGGNGALIVDNSTTNAASITYTYQTSAHANGAFNLGGSDVLNLSFGSVASGATPSALTFDVYNLLGSYGLQIVSVNQTQGAGIYTLGGLTGVTNLAAGGNTGGTVGMLAQTPSLPTTYNGQWLITIADTSVGVGNVFGANTSNVEQLTLNVTANVAAVPEPETLAMMLAGLGAVGFMARRRKTRQ